jgi:hypothetical protein
VVRYNPILGGLPGSTSGTPIVRGDGYTDPTQVPPDQLVRKDHRGKKILTARTGRHLMVHIYNALNDNDKETFVEQILCKQTKVEAMERGIDPGEYFDTLSARREDVLALFRAMPAGEATPGVLLRQVGGGVTRIGLEGLAAKSLPYVGIDMVFERGPDDEKRQWKLRSFVVPEGSGS